MSESGWASGTIAPPTEGEGVRPLNPHDPDPAAEGIPDQAAHDTPVVEPVAAAETDPKPKVRPGRSFAHLIRTKRETRFGLAALISFLILVAILIANKGSKGSHAPPPNQIPGSPDVSSSSHEHPGTSEKAEPAGGEETGVAPTSSTPNLPAQAAQAAAPGPESDDDRRTSKPAQVEQPEGEPVPLPPPATAAETGTTTPQMEPDATTPPPPAGSPPPPPPLSTPQPPLPTPQPASPIPAEVSPDSAAAPIQAPMPSPEPNSLLTPTTDQASGFVPGPTPTPAEEPAAPSPSEPTPSDEPGPAPDPTPPEEAELPAPPMGPGTNPDQPPLEAQADPPSSSAPPVVPPMPQVPDEPPPEVDPAVAERPTVEPPPASGGQAPMAPAQAGPGPPVEPTPRVEPPPPAQPLPRDTEVSLPSVAAPPESREGSASSPDESHLETVPARASELPNFISPPAPSDPVTLKSAGASDKQGAWVPLPNVGMRRSGGDVMALRDRSEISSRTRPEPKAPGARDQVEPVPHTVKSGENFWTISRLYYGSGRYYLALWQANRRLVPDDPKNLRVGMTIRIPPPEALDRSLIRTPARTPASGPAPPMRKLSRPNLRADHAGRSTRRTSEIELALPVAEPLHEHDSGHPVDADPDLEAHYRPRRPVYKVRSYETLRSIARDTLGDSRRASEILELNRDVIDNPHQLTPGQIIQLPEDARLGRRAR